MKAPWVCIYSAHQGEEPNGLFYFFTQHLFLFSGWRHELCDQHWAKPVFYSFWTAVNMMSVSRCGYQLRGQPNIGLKARDPSVLSPQHPKSSVCLSVPAMLLIALPPTLLIITSVPSKWKSGTFRWKSGSILSLERCSLPPPTTPPGTPTSRLTWGITGPGLRVIITPGKCTNLVTVSLAQP